jgi:thiol-disulfide isomerase/thioredoxin
MSGVFSVGEPNFSVIITGASIDPSLDFEFQLLNGSNVMLSDFEGKPIILDFFATWCAPCEDQERELSKLHNQFPKVTILSLSVEPDDSITILSEFKTENNITWIVGRDFLQQASEIFSITSIPTVAYIGYFGTLLQQKIGVQSFSTMTDWINSDNETIEPTSEISTTTEAKSTTTTVILTNITSGLELFSLFFGMICILILKTKKSKI